jgi:hypothetical protein
VIDLVRELAPVCDDAAVVVMLKRLAYGSPYGLFADFGEEAQ